jgi:hypothetical protein
MPENTQLFRSDKNKSGIPYLTDSAEIWIIVSNWNAYLNTIKLEKKGKFQEVFL